MGSIFVNSQVSYGTTTVEVLPGSGHWRFCSQWQLIRLARIVPYYRLALGDVNGDGRLDIVTAEFRPAIRSGYCWGRRVATFAAV